MHKIIKRTQPVVLIYHAHHIIIFSKKKEKKCSKKCRVRTGNTHTITTKRDKTKQTYILQYNIQTFVQKVNKTKEATETN